MSLLEDISGIALEIGNNEMLVLGDGYTSVPSDVRLLSAIADVVFDKQVLIEDSELYYMYRNVHKIAHEQTILASGLRYDITVIPSGLLGSEYIKTAGHHHAVDSASGFEFTEIYEVLSGSALYLMQKLAKDRSMIEDGYFVYAKPGDKVVIPPGYGHVTINPFKETLVMANWVGSTWSSDYSPVRNMHGAAWYVLSGDVACECGFRVALADLDSQANDLPEILIKPNKNWSFSEDFKPEFRMAANCLPESLKAEMPMYLDYLARPEAYRFLLQPELTESL